MREREECRCTCVGRKGASGEETRGNKNCKTYGGVEKHNSPAPLDVPLPFH